MTIYRGELNIFQDGQGSVIPITLSPSDVPADGLTFDVSSLIQPSGQQFGYIAGLTVDATGANVASGLISVYFAGGSNLTRNANGGNTQVYKASGPCQQITIKNLAWTSGQIILVLWNSPPANELQSPLTVVAQGTVAISGTPTVQFAPGQTVNVGGPVSISGTPTVQFAPGQSINIGNITTGSITFTNSQINVAHEATSIIFNVTNIDGYGQVQLLNNTINGTIRSIDMRAAGVQAFGGSQILSFLLRNVAVSQNFYQAILGCGPEMEQNIDVVSLAVLAIPFTGGLIVQQFGASTGIAGQLNVTIGYS